MFGRRAALSTSILSAALACALSVACSSSTKSEDPPAAKEKTTPDAGLTLPGPSGTLPTGSDSGTPAADSGSTAGTTVNGITGPSFDITKIASIQGTFVTEKAPVDGVQTNATVTWSFKIDSITPPPSSTAKWSAEATNVVGGNIADFPPVSGLALSLQQAAAPAQYEFYADDFGTPRNYVLVQLAEGHLIEFYFYRRLIDDTEPQPVADKPKDVVYTVK